MSETDAVYALAHPSYAFRAQADTMVVDAEEVGAIVSALEAERDRLRAVVEHLRDSAVSGITQARDDEYDEGNRDAWIYVRNVCDGKAGPAVALDGSEVMGE